MHFYKIIWVKLVIDLFQFFRSERSAAEMCDSGGRRSAKQASQPECNTSVPVPCSFHTLHQTCIRKVQTIN